MSETQKLTPVQVAKMTKAPKSPAKAPFAAYSDKAGVGPDAVTRDYAPVNTPESRVTA